MKHKINGKPAYLVAKEKGIPRQTFYERIRNGLSVQEAATRPLRRRRGWQGWRYLVAKDGYIKTCFSTSEVAKFLGTSKNTISGLFYKKGNKIELFGYTVTRINKRGDK